MIEYFIKYKWTINDMTSHEWGIDAAGFTHYGKQTDNRLRNTKGVCIDNNGWVIIAHFDANGVWTTPRIDCKADKFEIYE
jgi:hypothetical protein